jgi:hypothetical protein
MGSPAHSRSWDNRYVTLWTELVQVRAFPYAVEWIGHPLHKMKTLPLIVFCPERSNRQVVGSGATVAATRPATKK